MMLKTKLFGLALGALASCGSFAMALEKDIVDTAVGAGNFKTLATALQAADLVNTMKGSGPFTVFAPTDEAFAKLPKGTVEELVKPENKAKLIAILTHHVVKGKVMSSDVVKVKGAVALGGQRLDVNASNGSVAIDGSKVVKADLACSNGVIHVIDTVMMPATDNIPAVADKAGSFKTLLAAVKAAGLVETLSGTGPFTVFAPTDEAFAKLGSTVSDLLKPENKAKLTAILTYHVVPGRIYSEDAVAAKAAKTVQGDQIKITTSDKGAFINDAKLVKTDIDASNGVIHVIDSVILPPAK
jgi:transforming growth factor-beta-induced protein